MNTNVFVRYMKKILSCIKASHFYYYLPLFLIILCCPTGAPSPEGDIRHGAHNSYTGGVRGQRPRVLREMLSSRLQNAQAAHTYAA